MKMTVETGRRLRRERGQTALPTIFPTTAPWAWRSLDFRFLRNGYRQRKQIDEAFRIFRVVSGHGETRESLAIERIGRHALCNRHIALEELEAHGARHALLRLGEISVQRFALRREPCAVIHELGIAQ